MAHRSSRDATPGRWAAAQPLRRATCDHGNRRVRATTRPATGESASRDATDGAVKRVTLTGIFHEKILEKYSDFVSLRLRERETAERPGRTKRKA